MTGHLSSGMVKNRYGEQYEAGLRVSTLLTFTVGFSLVPGSIFGTVQNAATGRFHQVTGVTVVGHRVVVGKLTSQIDPIGYWPGIATTDD